MKKCPIFIFILLLCVLLIFSGCTKKEAPKKVSLFNRATDTAKEPGYHRQNTLWFGFDLLLGPKEEVMIYTSFLNYLEKATGRRFRIKFTEKYEDTVENLGRGITHIAAVGTLNYVIGAEKYGIKYLASGVNQDGDPQYHAVIFTRPNSSIRSVEDLRGKCFAFGSKISAQGHLIPRKMLEDAGITLQDLRKNIYTGSNINTVKSVMNGECDAGGIQDTLAKRLDLEGTIRILKISKPYPSSVIAYTSTLDPKVVDAIRTALLDLEPDGMHKGVLLDWHKTEMPLGFTTIDERELHKVTTLAMEYGLLTE